MWLTEYENYCREFDKFYVGYNTWQSTMVTICIVLKTLVLIEDVVSSYEFSYEVILTTETKLNLWHPINE